MRNAAAAVRNAYLHLCAHRRCRRRCRASSRSRNVQLGQRVGPGTPLMAVVPLDQVWVDANFKEPQLASMRIGQPVTLTRRPVRRQRACTTARWPASAPAPARRFALLPAQNATGNWIKIVQRVPVRIALDPRELAEHPLQIGLSMQRRGRCARSRAARGCRSSRSNAPAYSTDVFGSSDATGGCARRSDHRRERAGARRAPRQVRGPSPRRSGSGDVGESPRLGGTPQGARARRPKPPRADHDR